MTMNKILSVTAVSWGLLCGGNAIAQNSDNTQGTQNQSNQQQKGQRQNLTPEQQQLRSQKMKEMKEWHQNRIQKEFDKIDTNKDGKVTKEEYKQFSDNAFNNLRQPDNDYFTVDDIKRYQLNKLDEMRAKKQQNGN